MKKQTNRLCVIIGLCLLAAAMCLLLFWQWGIYSAQQKLEHYVQTICALTPEPQSAAPEERQDNDMPVLSIEETDFVGLLEMPAFDSSLPVCADWGKVSQYPCCLSGSVYDRTIQIGGTSQKGQYDFYREISVGDPVFFTDMEGNCFSYVVTDIRYEKHADQTTLQPEDAALILFIKNIYSFEYIIVSCNSFR